MKKIKLNQKLVLNKETIANLNNEQMNTIVGGATFSLIACKTIKYACETNLNSNGATCCVTLAINCETTPGTSCDYHQCTLYQCIPG